jgi:RNA:NAD 2'-phosphotransferase (TPT1/KptA family)
MKKSTVFVTADERHAAGRRASHFLRVSVAEFKGVADEFGFVVIENLIANLIQEIPQLTVEHR